MAEIKHNTLMVEGMTCNNCALGITRKLGKIGVKDVHTNFSTGEVSFEPHATISDDEIKQAIHSIGFKVLENEATTEGLTSVEKKFYATLPLTLILFSTMFLPANWWVHNPWVQFGLCLPVFLLGLYHFGKSAIGGIRSGIANMDVLILLGSTAAFGYSLVGFLLHQGTDQMHDYLFFETTATIITLVLLGNVLEHRSVAQTTSAIKSLSALQRITAKRRSKKTGVVEEVDAALLRKNDVLLLREGDKVPCDGQLLEGNLEVDEHMLTGEALPATKDKQAKLIAGTIVVRGNGAMIATSVGGETVLSKIIQLVKQAQREKPDIQKLGDQVSNIFVPAVLGISVTTFLLSFFLFDISLKIALMNAVAVVVISCPCAMGLATPTAVIAGIGRAAKKGILIKGGRTLEELAKAQFVIFDKTGTLTTGAFTIDTFEVTSEISQTHAQAAILALEQLSAHPIAKSLVSALENTATPLVLENIEELRGVGMRGVDLEGNVWSFGSNQISGSDTARDGALYLLKNNIQVAKLTLKDAIKADAKPLVDALKVKGITPILLSGDQREKCEQLANELGITEVYSEQLPDQKLEQVKAYKAKGQTIMVGDGINDAPALAAAHVGISLADATQIAIHASQVVILNGQSLLNVFEAWKIGNHTFKTIKQNLFWAFAYNIVAIPMAAIGLLNPMVAALAMAFSDVVVIGNSIRLKTKKLS